MNQLYVIVGLFLGLLLVGCESQENIINTDIVKERIENYNESYDELPFGPPKVDIGFESEVDKTIVFEVIIDGLKVDLITIEPEFTGKIVKMYGLKDQNSTIEVIAQDQSGILDEIEFAPISRTYVYYTEGGLVVTQSPYRVW